MSDLLTPYLLHPQVKRQTQKNILYIGGITTLSTRHTSHNPCTASLLTRHSTRH